MELTSEEGLLAMIKSRHFGIWFRAFLLFSVLFCVSSEARAQTYSLSIWPPLLEVMIQPGRSITQVYKLTNNSESDLQITPVIYTFEPQGENGQIRIKNQELSTKNQGSFFSFDSGEKFDEPFNLKVGSTRDLVLKVNIPSNVQENDFYYTLLFSSINPLADEQGNTKTTSVTQIGSNILLTVSKNGKPPFLGRIKNFSAPTIIDSFSPVNFNVVLENWGKYFWKPFGNIKIIGMLKQNDEVKLLEQNVLAGSFRRLAIDPYQPKLPLGPFKAKLEFTPSESEEISSTNGQKLNTTIIFWYLPYKLALILLGLLIILSTVKKIKKKIQHN